MRYILLLIVFIWFTYEMYGFYIRYKDDRREMDYCIATGYPTPKCVEIMGGTEWFKPLRKPMLKMMAMMRNI